MRKFLLILVAALLLSVAACAAPGQPAAEPQAELSEPLTVRICGDGVEGGEQSVDLNALYQQYASSAVYSTVNNWPLPKFYAASGVPVAQVLAAAGVGDYGTVNFAAADGYNITLTRQQLEEPRYSYPGLLSGDESGAEQVEPILALAFKEDSDDLAEILPDQPAFIFGQANIFEHTNPAFIENISVITVSAAPPEQWPLAYTFPVPGEVRAGDLVKLQHDSFGLVKLHYTTDGSDPDQLSPMYNPSTYQPELNVPLTINEDTLIKVRVYGYGKQPSDIAEWRFTVAQ
ncbi:MAG: FN3 associated domain-containing protein [Bacillota bacterium]|nr:FN3 associated domain-containing protein [Bacillota bacterium]